MQTGVVYHIGVKSDIVWSLTRLCVQVWCISVGPVPQSSVFFIHLEFPDDEIGMSECEICIIFKISPNI